MSVKEDLTAALELLREDGWRQNAMGMLRGSPHCILGAITLVTSDFIPSQKTLRDIIDSRHPAIRVSLTYWNDTPGRTFDEVQELFLTAINV